MRPASTVPPRTVAHSRRRFACHVKGHIASLVRRNALRWPAGRSALYGRLWGWHQRTRQAFRRRDTGDEAPLFTTRGPWTALP